MRGNCLANCLPLFGLLLVVSTNVVHSADLPEPLVLCSSASPNGLNPRRARQQLAISRSLAVLADVDNIVPLHLFAQQNETDSQLDDKIRCAIRLEACPNCVIDVFWNAADSSFTDFQIQSFANCDNGEDADLLLAQEDDHRPCFSLHFIEERADRPLPVDAESSIAQLFNPAFIYRRVSIWENGAEGSTFSSTGNSLLVVATLRHTGADAQLARYISQRLFPIEISVKVAVANIRMEIYEEGSAANNWTLSRQFVQSPRYPGAYPRGVHRNWTLGAADLRSHVRLAFDDFHLHHSSELRILDTDGTELFNSRREHGQRPPVLRSRGYRLSIVFMAHDFTQPIGFRAKYRAIPSFGGEEMEAETNCDEHLEGFGGRISLDGQRQLLNRRVDCIWLIGRFGSPPGQFDHLFLRVDEFRLLGEDVRLELREGGHSTGRVLLELDGEQTDKQLIQKQPEEGFTTALGEQQDVPAFYLRLRGRLASVTGLSVSYAHFFRWPTAQCPGGADQQFHCDNGRCLKATLRCDGFDHCGDSSDELCHFPATRRTTADEEDLSVPSGVLTAAFGVLSIFLLVLLLVLFASRTARRHLVPPLGSLANVRCPLRQRRRTTTHHCCEAHHQQQRPPNARSGGEVTAAGSGGTASRRRPVEQEQRHTTACANRRNSSALATQLDFALLNSLMGPQLGGPSLQQLGERRFFVLPADQAAAPPISLIEAPPSYADALKHPKVPLPNLRPAPIGTTTNDEASSPSAHRNMAFQLSPTELLRTMARGEQEQEEEQHEEVEEDSPGLLARSIGSSPFASARLGESQCDEEQQQQRDEGEKGTGECCSDTNCRTSIPGTSGQVRSPAHSPGREPNDGETIHSERCD